MGEAGVSLTAAPRSLPPSLIVFFFLPQSFSFTVC